MGEPIVSMVERRNTGVTGQTMRPGGDAALPVITEPETDNTNKEEAMVSQCER
jgi:hypothetical protein